MEMFEEISSDLIKFLYEILYRLIVSVEWFDIEICQNFIDSNQSLLNDMKIMCDFIKFDHTIS